MAYWSLLLKCHQMRLVFISIFLYHNGSVKQVLQIFRITKSDKIEPAGYCIAVSHDVDEFDCLNHAAKSDILKVVSSSRGFVN